MTKEQLIELLNGNLWVSGQTTESHTVMGVERAAEKIATKFFLMEEEIKRLQEQKYAVMVPWDNDDYIYVTRPTGEMYEVEPILYDTYEQARDASRIWGKFAKVVNGEEDDTTN